MAVILRALLVAAALLAGGPLAAEQGDYEEFGAFLAQLRAILRASALGPVRMMLPMLTAVTEIEQTHELVEQARAELRHRRQAFDPELPIGGMIEVPAAAVVAGLFATKLDFLSIGTNDLI